MPLRPLVPLLDRRAVGGWTLALVASWTGTWLLFQRAAAAFPVLTGHRTATLFWSCAKLVVWLVPIVVWLRALHRPLLATLGLDHARGLARGIAVSVAFLGVSAWLDARVLAAWPTLPTNASTDPVVLLLVGCFAPLAEEVLFRGFALAGLQTRGVGFWRANAEAALCFVALHVPGWCFQGRSPADQLALGGRIAVLGFLFGALRAGGGSLWPSVVLHVVNNAWRAGLFVWAWQSLR